MRTMSKTLRVAVAAFAIALMGAGGASARPVPPPGGFRGPTHVHVSWAQRHPWRAEVNRRLARQEHRINRDLREGDISRKQARHLHREDRFVRREERFMASQHHSHITRAEWRALNQEENGISRQIGRHADRRALNQPAKLRALNHIR